jgi:2-oxoglutarate dehydrogenase E1 component
MDGLSFHALAEIEALYDQFRKDPERVSPEWRGFFVGWELGTSRPGKGGAGATAVRVSRLIDAYRTYGHLEAHLDPLAVSPPPLAEVLQPHRWGFSASSGGEMVPTLGFLPEKEVSLSRLIEVLKETYCGSVGVEYMELSSPELERWMQERIEPGFRLPFSASEKLEILHDLRRAELFEAFIHTKFVGQKRFSLEGGETLIPMLTSLLEKAADQGALEAVIGMAHRGRLNVLTNILKKPYAAVFHEFEDHYEPQEFEGTGDVKYHRGFTGALTTKQGRSIQITLAANPSHLESVDPIVAGEARAKQMVRGKREVVPILIHGDASLAGQGVVYETLQMGRLNGYGVGGTIHIVINNQIGFTTLPKDGRSTRYCTDIALAFGAPVFHVNAEEPEHAVYATLLALEIRQKFGIDVFIDLYCYRKYGHNESDEPAFTQPIEYQTIRQKTPIRKLYEEKLLAEGVLTAEGAEQQAATFRAGLEAAMAAVSKESATPVVESPIPKVVPFALPSIEELTALTDEFCTVPQGLTIHPKISRLLEERKGMVRKSIDWGLGEMLAYGVLLTRGVHVRISGQDVRRGTFSHRHAVWADQEREERYFALSHLKRGQAPFDIFNSPLSEFAVLGFEFGYSIAYPKSVVIWEAQFGDFSNGAQVVIDQYIASSAQKWGLKSNLTLMLPHGYEGQGPEHSSARIERFLQLAGDDNLRIVNCTTPAQLFHVIIRQGTSPVLRPLILFTPKGLLRAPACRSAPLEFTRGEFQPILDDPAPPKEVKRLLLCSGKVYYDLAEARGTYPAAILRLEEIYPFPTKSCIENLQKYPKAEVVWVQEEPENMGPWEYVKPHLEAAANRPVRLIGRKRSSVTASGSHSAHERERAAILKEAFSRES